MKNSFVLLVVLLSGVVGATTEPSFGPQVNRDDQYRFSWYMATNSYAAYRDFGLNLVIDRYYSGWFLQNEQKRQAEIDRIVPYVREMGRDGIDFVYQMVLENKALQRDEFRALSPDGKIAKSIDMSYGPTQRQALEFVRQVALTFTNLPALVGVQGYSEVRGKPSWRPDYVAACRAANGFDPPREMREGTAAFVRTRADFPLSGIVDEDYAPFKYLSWFWKSGDGWGDYTDAASEVFGQIVGRKLFSFADPIIRTPPIWGSGGRHLGVGNHWLYPLPSPCDIAEAVAEVQAMARGTPGMKVFMMVQGFCYRSYTAPIGKTVENPPDWLKDERFAKISYLTQPPDVMREALWMLLMRRADGVGTYSQQHLGVAESRCTNTNTFYAMDDVFRNVATPLGPLLRALPERPPEVALLTSAASSLLAGGGSSWGWGSSVGSMLVGAGLMPYVLYEEEIARDGLPPTVKVIVTESSCRAFTTRTAKALRAFQDRGGILVAGSNDLAPGLLADLDMPEGLVGRYDRSTWNGRGDRLGANAVGRELKRALSPTYAPYADTENEDIVLHVRSYRAGDYLFAVNDRRTFGDYVGQWRQQEDKGLPNAGVVTVARADTKAVYDLVAHRAVPFRVANGKTEIDVVYTTTDGRIFLVAPRPLAPLVIRREGDEVVVTSSDKDVMIPIEVAVDGEKPRTGVVADGVWRRKYPHGAKLRVTNFADGTVAYAAHGVPFKIGIAGYTFNKVGLDRAVETMRAIDCRALCHKDFFLKYDATDAEIAAFKAKMAAAGLEVLATGPLYSADAGEIRRQFEFAKKLGVRILVGVPYALGPGKTELDEDSVESEALLDVVDKLVKEFDMVYAIHNHGPDMTNLFPTAESVLKRIGNRDCRIGVCLDIGHEQRAGCDPVAFIRAHADRLYDVHLKNIIVDPKQNRAMPGPRGELDIFGVFQALTDVGYTGVCHIEYERDKENNAMGLAESFGFYRGVACGVRLK